MKTFAAFLVIGLFSSLLFADLKDAGGNSMNESMKKLGIPGITFEFASIVGGGFDNPMRTVATSVQNATQQKCANKQIAELKKMVDMVGAEHLAKEMKRTKGKLAVRVFDISALQTSGDFIGNSQTAKAVTAVLRKEKTGFVCDPVPAADIIKNLETGEYRMKLRSAVESGKKSTGGTAQ